MTRTRILLVLLIVVLAAVITFEAVYIYVSYYRAPIAILETGGIQAQLVPGHEGDARVGGMILLASAVRTLRNDTYRNRSLLLDAGNSLFQDRAHQDFSRNIPGYLRQMGFNAITLGFRDFSVVRDVDWSMAPLVLACNVKVDPAAQAKLPRFVPARLFVIRKERIAVIGVIDPESADYQDAEHMRGIQIDNREQTLEAIKIQVDEWRPKVDVVVLLSSALNPSSNKYFAEKEPRLDLIVGLQAAGQAPITKVKNTAIVTASGGGTTIGMAYAIPASRGQAARLEARSEMDVNSEQFESDPEMSEKARRYWIDSILSQPHEEDEHVIGSVKDRANGVPLSLEHPLFLYHPYWSYFESPMLRLLADAMREQYPQAKGAQPSPKVDIAFVNSGTLEDGLHPDNPSGIVTVSMLRHALPYDNKVVKIFLNKKQILNILNSDAMRDRGLIGVSGLDYVWDYNTGRVDEASLRLESATGKVPLTNRQYTVVVSDFILNGGDGYMKGTSFDEVRKKNQPSATDPAMVDLLRKYIYSKSPIAAPREPRARFLR